MARAVYEKPRSTREIAKGQTRVLVENPVPLPIFHYISHVECSGIEIGSPWERPVTNHLSNNIAKVLFVYQQSTQDVKCYTPKIS